MSRRRWLLALLVAGAAVLLGLLLRWESARHEISGIASSCRISDRWDCDRVQASEQASVLGISVSVWGAAGYLVLLAWLAAARRTGPTLLAASGALVLIFVLASGYYFYVSWFEIGAVCLYCSAMQLCALALAFLVLPPARRALRHRIEGGRLALGGLLAAGVLALAVSGESYASRRAELLRLFETVEGAAVRVDVSDALVLGDPDTPNSVLIFFDFGCPFCEQCYHKAARLAQAYPNDVHFIFKHFPLDRTCNRKNVDSTSHHGACRAAAAGQAAALEGKSEEALAYLFKHQGDGFSKLVLNGLGRKIGLGAATWEQLQAEPRVTEIVQRDIEEGGALELTYVPVAYLNGRSIDAHRLAQRVRRAVNRPAPNKPVKKKRSPGGEGDEKADGGEEEDD